MLMQSPETLLWVISVAIFASVAGIVYFVGCVFLRA